MENDHLFIHKNHLQIFVLEKGLLIFNPCSIWLQLMSTLIGEWNYQNIAYSPKEAEHGTWRGMHTIVMKPWADDIDFSI